MGTERRAFVLGMIYAAWMMACRHENTYAVEILEELGYSVDHLQRIARVEQYQFPPFIWHDLRRKEDR
jgi:hypothetical protein